MKKLYSKPKLNRYGTVKDITMRRRGRRKDFRAHRRAHDRPPTTGS